MLIFVNILNPIKNLCLKLAIEEVADSIFNPHNKINSYINPAIKLSKNGCVFTKFEIRIVKIK